MRRLVHRPWVCGPVVLQLGFPLLPDHLSDEGIDISICSSSGRRWYRGGGRGWWFWWRFCDQTTSTRVATLFNGFGRGMEGHLNLQTRSGQSFTRLLCVTFLHDTWRSYLRNCIVLYRVFPRMVISFPTNIIRAKRSSLQCRVQCKSSDSEPLSLHSFCQ